MLAQYLKDYAQSDGTTALMLAGMKDTGITEAAIRALCEAQAGKRIKKDGNTALLLALY